MLEQNILVLILKITDCTGNGIKNVVPLSIKACFIKEF